MHTVSHTRVHSFSVRTAWCVVKTYCAVIGCHRWLADWLRCNHTRSDTRIRIKTVATKSATEEMNQNASHCAMARCAHDRFKRINVIIIAAADVAVISDTASHVPTPMNASIQSMWHSHQVPINSNTLESKCERSGKNGQFNQMRVAGVRRSNKNITNS